MTSVEHPNREDVMAWLDGELPGEPAAALGTHVEACESCRALVDDLRTVSRGLQTWRVEPAPESLVARLGSSSAAAPVSTPLSGLLRWRWQVAASLAVMALVGSVWISRGRPVTSEEAEASSTTPLGGPGGGGGGSAPRRPAASGPSYPPPVSGAQGQQGQGGTFRQAQDQVSPAAPLIARTASLRVSVTDVDQARAALERYLAGIGGSMAQMTVEGQRPAARTLTAVVKVPPKNLDAALVALRAFGRVEHESQSSDDVTAEAIDLDARLANGRRTEQRLASIVERRTGDVKDVLEAEREIARVRGEIERMEAQRKYLLSRVAMAAINLMLSEERRAEIAPESPSVRRDLGNAFRDGVRTSLAVVFGTVVLLLRIGPTLLLAALLVGSVFGVRSLFHRKRGVGAAAR